MNNDDSLPSITSPDESNKPHSGENSRPNVAVVNDASSPSSRRDVGRQFCRKTAAVQPGFAVNNDESLPAVETTDSPTPVMDARLQCKPSRRSIEPELAANNDDSSPPAVMHAAANNADTAR